MSDDQACRSCGASFIYQAGGRVCSREIAIIETGVYDGVLYWQCPFCKIIRHRWKLGTELRTLADAVLRTHFPHLAA